MNLDRNLEDCIKYSRMHGCIDATLDILNSNREGSVNERMDFITRSLRILVAKLKEEASR